MILSKNIMHTANTASSPPPPPLSRVDVVVNSSNSTRESYSGATCVTYSTLVNVRMR